MIGADYEKVSFVLMGLDLLEPMTFITDTIVGFMSLFFGWRLLKIKKEGTFYHYWTYFFLIFGFGTLLGGLGHTFYNYWGVSGKIPSWISGVLCVYYLEKAMISQIKDWDVVRKLNKVSFWKMVAITIVVAVICTMGPITEKPQLGFLPIAINTILGVVLAAGVIGRKLAKSTHELFNGFFWGVMVMLPSAFIFLLKVNPHPWFNKNDVSHVLLGAGITLFFLACRNLLLKTEDAVYVWPQAESAIEASPEVAVAK